MSTKFIIFHKNRSLTEIHYISQRRRTKTSWPISQPTQHKSHLRPISHQFKAKKMHVHALMRVPQLNRDDGSPGGVSTGGAVKLEDDLVRKTAATVEVQGRRCSQVDGGGSAGQRRR